jgi:hypothetical protein
MSVAPEPTKQNARGEEMSHWKQIVPMVLLIPLPKTSWTWSGTSPDLVALSIQGHRSQSGRPELSATRLGR